MLVLQSCTDPLHIVPGTSSETFPTSSDGTYSVGNVKVERDRNMQEGEVVNVNVNVKTESDIGSEEEKCVVIKGEEDLYSEEEEVEEENVGIKEEEDTDIKEEVSSVDTV
jgi:hypothetical protein